MTNFKNATCKFTFLVDQPLMDIDTIVYAGLFENDEFDYRESAVIDVVEEITEAKSVFVNLTDENFSRLGDALLKIARIFKAAGYGLISLSAHCTDDATDGTVVEEHWCLVNDHIVASARQGAIGSILRDEDGGWRDTTGTVFGSDNREPATLDVLSDIFSQKWAEKLLESIFVIAGAGEDRPEVITREELNEALGNILRAGFDAVDTVDEIEDVVAGVHLDN